MTEAPGRARAAYAEEGEGGFVRRTHLFVGRHGFDDLEAETIGSRPALEESRQAFSPERMVVDEDEAKHVVRFVFLFRGHGVVLPTSFHVQATLKRAVLACRRLE